MLFVQLEFNNENVRTGLRLKSYSFFFFMLAARVITVLYRSRSYINLFSTTSNQILSTIAFSDFKMFVWNTLRFVNNYFFEQNFKITEKLIMKIKSS